MKWILIPALIAVSASACSKLPADEPVPEVKMITETVTATNGDGTKASISDGLAFSWTAGDHIAVHVSNGGNHQYVLTSADGASGASVSAGSASFTIVYEEGYARDAFAVFPSTLVSVDAASYGQSGTALDLTLPASYTLAQVSGITTPCPMIATNTPEEGWTFKQLCGLLRLTVGGIPTDDGTYLKVDFGGRQVSGTFSIASPVTPGTSTIATSSCSADDKITITELGGVSEVTVNLPLPVGESGDVVVTAFNGSNVPVKVKPVEAASVPPAKQTSHRPERIMSRAEPMASVPEVHAVIAVRAKPLIPSSLATFAGASLLMISGTVSGRTWRGPRSMKRRIDS